MPSTTGNTIASICQKCENDARKRSETLTRELSLPLLAPPAGSDALVVLDDGMVDEDEVLGGLVVLEVVVEMVVLGVVEVVEVDVLEVVVVVLLLVLLVLLLIRLLVLRV